MDKAEAISKVRAYRRLLLQHLPVEQVYLFGSYAAGRQREDSDIDVAVVVAEAPGDFFTVNPLLWRLRRQIDERIEPILIERKNDDANFLGDIALTGIEIA